MKTKRFWNWARDADGNRELRLEGAIAEESWYDDDITPKIFRDELFAESGPVTIRVNSPGGDCIAASQIYTMLMDYPHDVTVKIDGVAASAASVVAMAGTKVCMSPTSLMMIHNPFTVAMGDSAEMRKAGQLLDEVKESIINAYQIKTSLPRARLSDLMNGETWMNANKAKELGFCDEVLFAEDEDAADVFESCFSFSRKAASACLMNKLKAAEPPKPASTIQWADLEKRLSLLK